MTDESTNWYSRYWASFKEVIAATWPEIAAGNLFQDSRLERTDWINDLNDNQIEANWCVVKIDIADSDDGPVDWQTYSVTAVVHYVAPVSAAIGGQTITEYLVGKQIALTRAFLAAGDAGLGTVMTSAPISMNADDPLTLVLLDAKLTYQSAGVQITCLITDTGQ